MNYLEAVTVCVDYEDCLAQAIPYNLPHLHRWLIVTDPRCVATRELCRRYGLECLVSEDGRCDNGFNKGRLVERGLQHLSATGFRLHLDSDIVLPRHFGHILEWANLQEDTIYGADRVMVKSREGWERLKRSGWLDGGQHGKNYVLFPEGYAVGTRWAGRLTGWVPIGFFQLWHSSQDEWRGVRVKPYPTRHGSACRTDVQHGMQWDRKKRVLLPECVVAHLEWENSPNGANWNGRKSLRFDTRAEDVS